MTSPSVCCCVTDVSYLSPPQEPDVRRGQADAGSGSADGEVLLH